MDDGAFFIGIFLLILIFGLSTQGTNIRERIDDIDVSADAHESTVSTVAQDAAHREELKNELERLRSRETEIEHELQTSTSGE